MADMNQCFFNGMCLTHSLCGVLACSIPSGVEGHTLLVDDQVSGILHSLFGALILMQCVDGSEF